MGYDWDELSWKWEIGDVVDVGEFFDDDDDDNEEREEEGESALVENVFC